MHVRSFTITDHSKSEKMTEFVTKFSITKNKYSLRLQSNFFGRLKAVLFFISRNLEAINQPVP